MCKLVVLNKNNSNVLFLFLILSLFLMKQVFLPSEELCQLLGEASEEGWLSEETIVEICKLFHLNKIDVLKYRNLV